MTLTVSFESKTLDGTVVYDLKNLDNASEVILDTSALNIKSTKVNGKEVSFELKPVTPIYGAPLRIPINPNESEIQVEISFSTTDKCTAIQFIQGDTGPYIFLNVKPFMPEVCFHALTHQQLNPLTNSQVIHQPW